MWQDGVVLLGCTGQPPGYGSGHMGGRSGDVQISAAIHGSSPISLCGRPGLSPDYKAWKRLAEDLWWRSTDKEVFFPSPTPCPAPLPVVHRLSLECFCLACGKICPSPPDSCCEDTFMFQQPMLGVSQHWGSSAAAPLPPGHWQPWCRRLGWGQGALLPHASRGTWKVQESCSAVCITSGAIQHQGVRKHFARRWSFFKLSVTILQPRGGKEKQPTKQAKKTFSRLQIGKFSDLKISWFFFFSPVTLKL